MIVSKLMWRTVKIFLAAGILLFLLLLYAVNPAESKWAPPCVFNEMTGLYCSGCGTLRAGHCLFHGDIGGAAAKNPLLFVLLPALLILQFNKKWLWHPYTGWSLLFIIVGYGILRNIPLWPFSLLAPH